MQKEQCYAAMLQVIVQRRREVATGEEKKKVMRAKRGRQETDDLSVDPWGIGGAAWAGSFWELGCGCMCRVQGARVQGCKGGLQRQGKATFSSPAV
jgi:hypothetical protein